MTIVSGARLQVGYVGSPNQTLATVGVPGASDSPKTVAGGQPPPSLPPQVLSRCDVPHQAPRPQWRRPIPGPVEHHVLSGGSQHSIVWFRLPRSIISFKHACRIRQA